MAIALPHCSFSAPAPELGRFTLLLLVPFMAAWKAWLTSDPNYWDASNQPRGSPWSPHEQRRPTFRALSLHSSQPVLRCQHTDHLHASTPSSDLGLREEQDVCVQAMTRTYLALLPELLHHAVFPLERAALNTSPWRHLPFWPSTVPWLG